MKSLKQSVLIILLLIIAGSTVVNAMRKRGSSRQAKRLDTYLKLINNFSKMFTTELSEQLTTEFSEQLTTELSEQLTTEPSEQLTTEPSEQLTTEPSEQLTTEPSEELPTEFSEQLTTEPSEQLTTEFSEQLPTELSEQLTTELSEQLTTKFSKQLTTELSEQLRKDKVPFMQQITLDDNDRLFVIGDIHARKKTIEEIIEVLNQAGAFEEIPLVEEETLTLKENVKVVFLGDYVDRGGNDLWVLIALLKLKLQNPEKVFLLAGNHENHISLNTFPKKEPLIKQFIQDPITAYNKKHTMKAYNILSKTYKKFFNLLPIILFIKYHGKIIQLNHGGISGSLAPQIHSFLETNKPIEKLEKNSYSLLWGRIKKNYDPIEWLPKNDADRKDFILTDWAKTIKKYSNKIVLFLRGHDHVLPSIHNNRNKRIKQIGYCIYNGKYSHRSFYKRKCKIKNKNYFFGWNNLKIITIISGAIYVGNKVTNNYETGLIGIETNPKNDFFPFKIKYLSIVNGDLLKIRE